jgi:hypothetical protein
MRCALTCLVVLCLGSGASSAQTPGLSPEQRDAILNFPLTLDRANHLITAMTAVTQHVMSQPDYLTRLAQSATLSPAERIAQMEKDPKVSSILKQENLTARDYLVGVPALRMALLAAQGASGPNIVASPANVAFAKANLAQLKPKMDQADGLGRR